MSEQSLIAQIVILFLLFTLAGAYLLARFSLSHLGKASRSTPPDTNVLLQFGGSGSKIDHPYKDDINAPYEVYTFEQDVEVKAFLLAEEVLPDREERTKSFAKTSILYSQDVSSLQDEAKITERITHAAQLAKNENILLRSL